MVKVKAKGLKDAINNTLEMEGDKLKIELVDKKDGGMLSSGSKIYEVKEI